MAHERIPPSVVAAITAAVAAYLESEPERLRIVLQGPVPAERWDAGLYGELGLLLSMAKRQGGGGR
jgi:hypothetical protein